MLKISLPGKDVNTASPEELAVDSTYDSLKLIIQNSNPYFGEILVKFSDNPANGTYNVFTYKHNFSYTPFYYIFFDISKSSKLLGSNTGFDTGALFLNDVFSEQIFQVTDTKDGFRLDYVVSTNTHFDMTDQYFSFRYFVFANDGL